MTYRSSTAASSVTNPPKAIVPRMSGLPVSSALSSAANVQAKQGGAVFFYSSTHTSTAVVAANFFSDGKALGMQAGDLVIGVSYSTAASAPKVYMAAVKTVSTSGATLSSHILVST